MCPRKVRYFNEPQWTMKTSFQRGNKKIRTVLNVCGFGFGAPDRNRKHRIYLGFFVFSIFLVFFSFMLQPQKNAHHPCGRWALSRFVGGMETTAISRGALLGGLGRGLGWPGPCVPQGHSVGVEAVSRLCQVCKSCCTLAE